MLSLLFLYEKKMPHYRTEIVNGLDSMKKLWDKFYVSTFRYSWVLLISGGCAEHCVVSWAGYRNSTMSLHRSNPSAAWVACTGVTALDTAGSYNTVESVCVVNTMKQKSSSQNTVSKIQNGAPIQCTHQQWNLPDSELFWVNLWEGSVYEGLGHDCPWLRF